MFGQLLTREIVRYWRSRQDLLNALAFFVIVVTLFPLAVTPEGRLLRLMGPGVIFVAALLSTLLSLEGLYKEDYHDGTLEYLVLQSGQPMTVVASKIAAHWLLSGLPLTLLSPVLGGMMQLSGHTIMVEFWALLLATPTLSLLGAVGSGLTVGLRQSGVLLALLVLPLYVPVLIFGTSAVMAAAMELSYSGQLALLGAILALALPLAPLAALASVRVSIR